MAGRRAKQLGDWRDDAACLGEDIHLFFPERSQVQANQAKAICANCQVRSDCLDEAIHNGERFGIWGGLDQEERRREARRRRARDY
jgi:WhiB family redox-sensing transcriptional regulator